MKTDFRWSTLVRLLAALEAEPVLIPRAKLPWRQWLRARAQTIAERQVDRVLGTSALEAQQPGERDRRQLVAEEIDRLLQRGGSALWNEP